MRSLWRMSLSLCLMLFVTTNVSQAQGKFDPNCDPANLMLVVDVSGSMSQAGKLKGLQLALENVIQQFQTTLRMGLIKFSGTQAPVVVPLGPDPQKLKDPAAVSAHVAKLLAAVKALKANGATPMTTAMRSARDEYIKILPSDPLHQDPDPLTMRRSFILLATDGEPTDGDPLPVIQALRKLKVGAKTYDIRTFVVGLGSADQIRPFQLGKYAQIGGTDKFLHALTPADLEPFFRDISKQASKEVCNGRDDDCDGQFDEDLVKDCQNKCGKGKQICHKGKWSLCDAPKPKPELCNSLDDDCDGQVDEGITNPCKTACGTGKQSCIEGDWSSCDAPRPVPEKCDGIDNDCDGQIDNGSLCPGGKCVIKPGKKVVCEIQCNKSKECPEGYNCDVPSNICQKGPCVDKQCNPGEICTLKDGKAVCKNICEGVKCEAGQTCGAKGTCINCYKDPCPPQMVCILGSCVVDKCHQMACDTSQSCREGKCLDNCVDNKCSAGSVCKKGVCEKDLCANVKCKTNEFCNSDGKCQLNKCLTTKDCGDKQVCNPVNGVCADDPCLRTHCPAGATCYLGECGMSPPKPTGQEGGFCKETRDCKGVGLSCVNKFCVKGGGGNDYIEGGCECSSSGLSNTSSLIFGLLLLGLLGFRRRRK